ncbi:MAG: hypothetical protein AB7Q81_13970 [Gammaproteobacteria bacterium]
MTLLAAPVQAEVPRRGPTTAAPTIPEPAPGEVHDADGHAPVPADMSPEARPGTFDAGHFGADPQYADKPYDPQAQLAIYGGKRGIPDAPRPPIEWGYPMYQGGDIGPGITLFGEKNRARPQLLAFGDLRLGAAYNDNGALDTAQMAARLNLNLDLRLTATERIHGFFRPLDRAEKGRQTRWEFGGNQRRLLGDTEGLLDMEPEALFFEGDLGQIAAGITGEYNRFDLPVSFGLMPLLFQNGVWMEDAILGGAVAVPAMNSPKFDISNMDVTFFGGFDRVTTRALREVNGALDDQGAAVYGTAIFIERREAYIELGYGYTHDTRADALGDFSYHNVTAAWTQRWLGKLSNSVRVIANFGQDPGGPRRQTADGWLLLVENSFITSKPYTLIPYANLFVGHDQPQSLARDFGSGGVLRNTGINFETDGLTGFPKLDDTANDTYGGALGVEYLFALNQQVVVELAGLETFGPDNKPGRVAPGHQFALGLRYQRPLTKRWIFRTDAILGAREHQDDLAGVRVEMRMKF